MPGAGDFAEVIAARHEFRHLFGPVRSRRMGLSLGIDLVPLKTCSFNCPFCQVGATTALTMERREYVPTAEVVDELERWVAGGGRADFITLAGSGEPTLHSKFGDILDHVRSRWAWRTALLSNGSLFSDAAVRRAAVKADIVKASFSAWDEASFSAINRAHASLAFSTFFSGLCAMREDYSGQYWLEVFLVRGINDRPGDVRRIAELVRRIRPDQVQLNTVVRPPADGSLLPVAREELSALAQLFDPPAVVIADVPSATGAVVSSQPVSGEQVIDLLRRHPCSADDMAVSLGIETSRLVILLDELLSSHRIVCTRVGERVLYRPV